MCSAHIVITHTCYSQHIYSNAFFAFFYIYFGIYTIRIIKKYILDYTLTRILQNVLFYNSGLRLCGDCRQCGGKGSAIDFYWSAPPPKSGCERDVYRASSAQSQIHILCLCLLTDSELSHLSPPSLISSTPPMCDKNNSTNKILCIEFWIWVIYQLRI